MYNTCLARGNPKRTLQGSLARLDYKWYTENYSTKPPSIKPPISRHPHDSRGCHSVTWACPNVFNAHLVLLRYKWRKKQTLVSWCCNVAHKPDLRTANYAPEFPRICCLLSPFSSVTTTAAIFAVVITAATVYVTSATAAILNVATTFTVIATVFTVSAAIYVISAVFTATAAISVSSASASNRSPL
jgi:hypothetical protein